MHSDTVYTLSSITMSLVTWLHVIVNNILSLHLPFLRLHLNTKICLGALTTFHFLYNMYLLKEIQERLLPLGRFQELVLFLFPLHQAVLAVHEEVLPLWILPSLSNPLEPDVYDSAEDLPCRCEPNMTMEPLLLQQYCLLRCQAAKPPLLVVMVLKAFLCGADQNSALYSSVPILFLFQHLQWWNLWSQQILDHWQC